METRPHAKNLRRGRCAEAGRVYLLTFVTHQRSPWFADWPIACAAARTLSAAESWPAARLLCWVLMPDHWHGLLELGAPTALSPAVGRARSAATRAWRPLLAAQGTPSRTAVQLWQRGYHDHAMRREEDLHAAARYIVANPLRAGLAGRAGDYPFWDAIWLNATPNEAM